MSGYPRTPERIWPGDDIPLLDVSPDGAWWLAGLFLGAAVLLLWALLDLREENLEQAVRIQTLETQVLQHKVLEASWKCSRVEQRRGGLVKWCMQSEGM